MQFMESNTTKTGSSVESGNHSSSHSGYRKLIGNIAFVTIFFGMLAGVSSCKDDKPAENTEQQAKTDSLARENDTLKAQNNAAHQQIDEYMTKASKLEDLIQMKDKEIARLTKDKEELMRNNKKLVAELKGNKKLISSLRDELADTNRVFAERLGVLENDRSNLMRQRDSLVSKYNQVVALGSVLHASNIRLSAINLKRDGKKEKDTKRARKADVLRIDFDIDEKPQETLIDEYHKFPQYIEVKVGPQSFFHYKAFFTTSNLHSIEMLSEQTKNQI